MENVPILNSLAALIRSLSQGQKRDFKKYTKFWGEKEKKYIRMFDCINDHLNGKKDPRQLLDVLLLDPENFPNKAQVRNVGAYLYDRILERMRISPESSPELHAVNALLQNVIFLFNKGLYNDCEIQIREAKRKATELDRPCYLLELMFWERRVVQLTHSTKDHHRDLEADFRAIKSLERRTLSELDAFLRFNELADELMYLIRKQLPLPADTDGRITALLIQFPDGLSEQFSPRTRLRFFHLLSLFFDLKSREENRAQNDCLEKTWYYQRKILDLYNSHELLKSEESIIYYGFISSYLNICLRLDKLNEPGRFADELKVDRNDAMLLSIVTSIQLQHFIKTSNFLAARNYIIDNDLTTSLTAWLDQLPETRLLPLFYLCAQVFFILEEYDHAGAWIDRLLSEFRSDTRPDIVELARMLEIICHFELGVYRHDDNPARPWHNLTRVLRRLGHLDDFRKLLLKVVEAVFLGKPARQIDPLVSRLDAQIFAHRPLLVYGIVMAWVRAKCRVKRVAEEVRLYS